MGSGGERDALASRRIGLATVYVGQLPGLSVGCVCVTTPPS